MPKPSNRERILTKGMQVVHERGFNGASVRDIVQAAGVPQGSFTNHFASKEAFGIEVIDRYRAAGCEVIDATLRNDALPPLQRLAAYIDHGIARAGQTDMRNGCLLGNLAAEICGHSEPIRERLADAFTQVQGAVEYCLRAAAAAGELPAGFAAADTAAFIVAALQGANLMAKTQRSPAPVERFKRILFGTILPKA